CRVGGLLCALPLEHVEETMRPLAIEAIAGGPAFVRGLAVVRGAPIPAVDAVVGVVEIPSGSLDTLPQLFQDTSLDAISAIGMLDADLLVVLRSTHLVPEDFWAVLETGCALA